MSENNNKAIIHHIGLKNFKGYQEASIPLAPITLFFGPNSAGKSTVFQALYLLKQTLQFAPADVPLLFRCDNGYVDLGSFEDVVFDHDKTRKVGISINGIEYVFGLEGKQMRLDAVNLPETMPIVRKNDAYFEDDSVLFREAYELIVNNREAILWSLEQRCILDAMNNLLNGSLKKPELPSPNNRKTLSDSEIDHLLFEYEIQKSQLKQQQRPSEYGFGLRERLAENYEKIFPAMCPEKDIQWLTHPDSNEDWDVHLGEGFDLRRKVSTVTERQAAVNDGSRWAWDPLVFEEEPLRSLFGKWSSEIREALASDEFKELLAIERSKAKAKIDFFKVPFSETELWKLYEASEKSFEVFFEHFLPRKIKEKLRFGIIPDEYFDNGIIVKSLVQDITNSFIYISTEHFEHTRMWFSLGWNEGFAEKSEKENAFMARMEATYGRKGFDKWDKEFTQLRETCLQRLKPIGPIRIMPRRIYWSAKSKTGDVGFMGEWVGDALLDEADKKKINEWLKNLTGYEVERHEVGTLLPGAYVLQVRDAAVRDAGQYVSITDVGFGISQILPLIAQLVVAKNSIITIEQPESQIHPQMQAKFADLVIESMTKNGNQVLVETHSEHIILRLLRRLRESAKNTEKESAIKASDVGVIYVSPSPNGSVVQKIEISDDGQVLSPWPGGFFPERVKELFGEA